MTRSSVPAGTGTRPTSPTPPGMRQTWWPRLLWSRDGALAVCGVALSRDCMPQLCAVLEQRASCFSLRRRGIVPPCGVGGRTPTAIAGRPCLFSAAGVCEAPRQMGEVRGWFKWVQTEAPRARQRTALVEKNRAALIIIQHASSLCTCHPHHHEHHSSALRT